MPFPRPTLTELQDQVSGDIQSSLPGTETLLRYSNLAITGKALASLANGHYGYLDWIAKQATPFGAEDEYLEGWAGLKSITRKPATAAACPCTFAGTASVTIPAGAMLIRNDGMAYTTVADITLDGGSGTVGIACAAAGADGNAPAGTVLTLAQAISGVVSGTPVSGPITGGADVESDDALRGRMLKAFANPPQGGSLSDYEQWALQVAGVTRCWPVPNGMGPLTMVLYFMMDDAEAAHGGFPQGSNGVAAAETRAVVATGDQLALANYIFAKQPATPIIYAIAPSPNNITLTIAGLSGASASVQTAVQAAAAQALFLGGTPGGTTDVSTIETAIGAVNGSAGFVITGIACSAGSIVSGSAGNMLSNAGHLPVLAGVNFV